MSNITPEHSEQMVNKWQQLAFLIEMLSIFSDAWNNESINHNAFDPVFGVPYDAMVNKQISAAMHEITMLSRVIVELGLLQQFNVTDQKLILEIISKPDNNEHIEQQEQVLPINTRIH